MTIQPVTHTKVRRAIKKGGAFGPAFRPRIRGGETDTLGDVAAVYTFHHCQRVRQTGYRSPFDPTTTPQSGAPAELVAS